MPCERNQSQYFARSHSTDINLYSADLAVEGTASIAVLHGVKVADDVELPSEQVFRLAQSALDAAFKAAKLDTSDVLNVRVVEARQLTPMGKYWFGGALTQSGEGAFLSVTTGHEATFLAGSSLVVCDIR